MALDIALLYFAECPNYVDALALLRAELAAEGLAGDSVRLIAVETEEEAMRLRFFGSPTIRVNGEDVAPLHDPAARPALACRTYRAADGRLGGVPPVEAIRAALRRARQG